MNHYFKWFFPILTQREEKDKMTNTIEIRTALNKGICSNHTGKMSDMLSFSTSVLLNEQCKKNQLIKGSICEKCYANKQLRHQSPHAEKLARNTALITSEIYPAECFPQINALYFRFEAFGDINNETQVFNYFNWAAANPLTMFALWTKNARLVDNAIKHGAIKPENLIIIYSSLFVNDPVHVEIVKRKYSFIDKVFTVYTKKYATENNKEINCGGRHCASCLRCYHKETETEISELLK